MEEREEKTDKQQAKMRKVFEEAYSGVRDAKFIYKVTLDRCLDSWDSSGSCTLTVRFQERE